MTSRAKFRTAYEEYEAAIPYPPETRDDYKRRWEEMRAAAAPKHVPRGGEISYFTDQVSCSCGWESRKYWDGLEYAWNEWLKHVADEFGLLPRRCACGKRYVPADGGEPCHDLVERREKS